ncbi:MAG: tRNA lysidine(34) synthetase TilS [Chitinophagales bacterium]|nr:tRNA lysidine(34) synthetase TilS [Chitinophagales bacterium]
MNKQKTLLQRFTEYNAANRMPSAKKRTLLTVSGGLDSVVMLDLFSKAAFPFAIAHCNFQLRGDEADADEAFVKDLGDKYQVPVFVKRFDTKAYAEEFKLSIQLAARELRYKWFEELRQQHKFKLVATAHHLNDNIETILYNFTKGTGLRGLRGIPARQGNVVRPLLFASREEIEKYADENKLAYREDSSNAEDKYTRNKIRHHIVPLLKEINPSLEKTIGEKIELLSEIEALYESRQRKVSRQLFLPKGSDIYIPLLKLKKMPHASSILYEYLKDFGFTSSQVDDMLSVIDEPAGKQFITDRARVIKDRRFFILTQLPEQDVTVKLIEKGDSEVSFNNFQFSIATVQLPVVIEHPSPQTEFVDSSKLEFPLLLRQWKAGDYFYPVGMGMKKKKVKKFLTDLKLPLHEKEKVLVLESNQKIVWVVGYRLDERFKIIPQTKQAHKLHVSKSN